MIEYIAILKRKMCRSSRWDVQIANIKTLSRYINGNYTTIDYDTQVFVSLSGRSH